MNETNKNLPPEFSTDELKMPEGTVSPVEEEHHGKLAVILSLFIIALILILVGLYLWFLNIEQNNTIPPQIIREVPEMPNDPETANAEASVQQLETLSPSNSVDAIEADLESTNLDQIDSELQAIDSELGTQNNEESQNDSTAQEEQAIETETNASTTNDSTATETEVTTEEVVDEQTATTTES